MSMNMCSQRHEEIVFDGKHCPLCEALAEIERLESDLTDHVFCGDDNK